MDLITSWDNTQVMVEADQLLAKRLLAREQEELTEKQKASLFMQLLEKRRKFFNAKRAEAKRNKPPTLAQQRKLYCNYLKNIEGHPLKELKGLKFDVIKDMFDKAFKRVNTFVDMNTEMVKAREEKEGSSEKKTTGSRKKSIAKRKAANEHSKEEGSSKRQRAEDESDTEEELKKCFEFAKPEEVEVNAIPLTTKHHVVDYKITTRGKPGHYEIFRVGGVSKVYHVFSQLQNEFDREDLGALWKLVKAKHGNKRHKEEFERVLWDDLKVMFEPDTTSEIWRSLQGYKVTGWKLYDSCGVHYARFKNLHIYMLVEKRYPLTPITIKNMLDNKLQADEWNEMVYQLLKLLVK
ncbi:hypothetical protein Tco_1076134 [Tanacetum coccineum]